MTNVTAPSIIEKKLLSFEEKKDALTACIEKLASAAVAFSGGVDSTLLLAVSFDLLGSRAAAVTGCSLSFPPRELKAAQAFTESLGIKHYLVDSEELNLPAFSQNPPNRCYLCKTELFTKIKNLAAEKNLSAVLEASNADDEGDYRPGLQAVRELGILSPLRQARLTKDEIRRWSKELNLPTWNKPAFACLASRFPYGESITPERLARLDKAESFLLSLGLNQVRVRLHEQATLARIETDEESFSLLSRGDLRQKVYGRFKELGFAYVAVDILGYRTGSMNLTLQK
ncbi:MAG: ATP-dependent sacrificial sulfur transferase LarE [Deltaproteobacteria bacterium]|jgi:uncharacterized protein|nr:ATP-dependent sacrificial sulfur transferase LarE [Deltaproteobacteria bacterium]